MSKKSDKSGSDKPIRVAIIEDDDWFRENLADELDAVEGFRCVGKYGTAEDAVSSLPDESPDVAIVDINLPGMNGIECLRELKPRCPDTDFLILTVYEESESIFDALLAGADGYLLKRSSTEEVLDAVRQVKQGGSPMTSQIARRVVQHFNRMGSATPHMAELSEREHRVLELLSRGDAYKQIADEMDVGINTIRMYIKAIYGKLRVHSRGEAVAKFREWPQEK